MIITNFITAEDIYKQAQIDYAISKLEELPVELLIPIFSKWAEDNRYIPEGISDFYGPFDPSLVPHMIEILDSLHPDSPWNIITLLKSVQSAGTTSVGENAIGAWIANKLGSILYLTSTKKMGEIRGSANIDSMIDNSNLAQFIKPISNRTNKKSKDSSLYKELDGNNKLVISSYNSIAELKSNTFNLIIEDELDEAKAELKDQGDTEKIIEGRTYALSMYKILQISTSSRAETSRIYKNFLKGDQREYNVPCPHCGEKQIINLKKRGEKSGLTFTREKDKNTGRKILIPETVRCICCHCGKDIYETKKMWKHRNGVWIPSAIAEDPLRRSYRAPGFISPFLSWRRICQSFIDTNFGDDLLTFKDFTINVLGKPWAAVKKSAKWEMLKERSEDYTLGDIPEGKLEVIGEHELYLGPLLLYAGVDVQLDRLEMMVTGFGPNGEKWIVDYKIFYGNTANIDDYSWNSLSDYVYEHEYKVCGNPSFILMCAVDSGYDPRKATKREKDFNNKAHIVYDFVAQRTDRFIAIMGTPDDKTIGVLKESRISDVNTSLTKRYMVAVSLLKESIMSVIEKSFGFNAIHIPSFQVDEGIKRDIPDEFYMQICSERYQENPKKPGKYGWFKIRARNEVLDVLVYSIAASTVHSLTSWSSDMWHDCYVNQLENIDDGIDDYDYDDI